MTDSWLDLGFDTGGSSLDPRACHLEYRRISGSQFPSSRLIPIVIVVRSSGSLPDTRLRLSRPLIVRVIILLLQPHITLLERSNFNKHILKICKPLLATIKQ